MEEGGNGGAIRRRGEAKEGWGFAADAARVTDERASSEDRRHTSGAVFVAIDSNLGAVVGEKEGAVASIPGNEGRITQAWETCAWTPRSEALLEAVLKRARVTTHPWLVACDADMSPVEFEKSLWSQKKRMHVVASENAFTCWSKSAKEELD